jgi:3-carboxy-cis,cis-muconate cycloisomerase
MLAFEEAWTRALMATGMASERDGEAALKALSGFNVESFRPASDRDGLPVPSLVARLREGLASGAAKAIHTGATSQDVIDTAMVLNGLAVLDRLDRRLQKLVSALIDLERRHGEAPLMARTRMQAALPATASLRLSAWQRLVQAQHDRMPALRDEIARVQIGGAIGLRDLPGANGDEVAKLVAYALGLKLAPVWHTDRSSMVSFGHWLTLLTGALGKIGQDVALMAQQGLDEIDLDGGGGSSAMPHKQNPILAETMIAIARYVAGLQGSLAQAMLHEQERSGAAWSLEWLTLPAMAEATGAALLRAETLVGSIRRIGTPG